MADLTIVSTTVAPGATGTSQVSGLAGTSISAGQAVYKDATTGTYKLTDCDSATVAARTCDGIALNTASSGQALTVLTGGPYTVGATVVVGTAYVASATAGGIAPIADLTTAAWPTLIGFATSASVINVTRVAAGVAKP